MCTPAALIKLTTDQIVALQQDTLLELLRRHPPTWPNSPVYNVARRLFDTTRELHQAIADLAGNDKPADTTTRPRPIYPGVRVTDGPEP